MESSAQDFFGFVIIPLWSMGCAMSFILGFGAGK